MNCLFNCDDHIHFHIFNRSSQIWIVSYAPNLKRNKLKKGLKKCSMEVEFFFRNTCKEKHQFIFWNRAQKQAIVKKDVYE